MIPDLASIMRKRYRMQRNLRFFAVLLFALSVIFAGFGAIELVGSLLSNGMPGFSVWYLCNAVPFLAGGLFLGMGSPRLVRWMLPLPKSGCPRCGYRLIALVEPRCPECGLDLPREFIERE